MSEVGQIECQTCEEKNLCSKKNFRDNFLKFFSLNLILIYILNHFYHFQPFSNYKKCAYLKEVIRRDSDQCGWGFDKPLSRTHGGLFNMCLIVIWYLCYAKFALVGL